jgi:hypothetical protein
MTGCSVTRKAPSFRRYSDLTPAIEEINFGRYKELINYLWILILSMGLLLLFSHYPDGPEQRPPPRESADPSWSGDRQHKPDSIS